MVRRMTWIGIGLFVAAILIGALGFGTSVVCMSGDPDAVLNVAVKLYDNGFFRACGVMLISGGVLFLGGILALGVSLAQKELPPPSS